MDEENQQLEAELKRLRPVAPAPELVGRIADELAGTQKRRNPWWVWAALPAAAALVFLLSRSVPSVGPAPAAFSRAPAQKTMQTTFKPVAAENLLLAARDEGLVTLPDGSTGRRVRRTYLDTITWKDPRSQASLKWSVPREEERVVPVVFQ